MSGILNMLFASENAGQNVLVTVVGPGGSGFFGYINGIQGSLTPSGFTISGTPPQLLGSDAATTYDFGLNVSGNPGKLGLFASITVFNQAGNPVTFLASASTYVGGGTSTWRWGTGSSSVWTAGGVNRNCTFN